jgi:ferredoxin-type protein NapH
MSEHIFLVNHKDKTSISSSIVLFMIASFLLFISLFLADHFVNSLGVYWSFGLTWGVFLVSLATIVIKESTSSAWLKSTHGRWIMTLILCTFYVAIYFQPLWIQGWITLLTPLAEFINGQPADQWFLYSFLYTYAVAIFGYKSLKRHGDTPYHRLRTSSLVFFQLTFAFLIPALLKRAQLPDFYFTYFWPLKPEYLLPFDYVMGQTGIISAEVNGLAVGRAMIIWGAMMSLIATPILTYYFGKRWYCSWVCGCGALAETFGDVWRTRTPKGRWVWQLERYLVHFSLLITIGVTIILWVNESGGRVLLGEDGSNWFWGGYGLWITMIFSGVIGVGFYPLLGPRIWCRFGCPQAAILGLLQRFISRFRITSNGEQCVSCGQCSAHCEMGIDVRAYAQEGAVIVRASCVGCGVCASVCPRGVLRLENQKTPRF